MLLVSLALWSYPYGRATYGASQNVKLPLHYAAVKGAPFEVMKLLLDANTEAAAAADKARSSAHAAPPPLHAAANLCALLLPLLLARTCHSTRRLLRRAPRTQAKKLPLHYAAAKGAPFEVMKLLLDAHHEASTAVDNVRAAEPTPTARYRHATCLILLLVVCGRYSLPRLHRPLRCAG